MRQPNVHSFLLTGEGVTLVGSLLNLALVLVKLATGIVGNSAALVADALHSLSDLTSDIVVLFGYRMGRLPEDANHPYGHGKVETLCTGVVGGILIAAGAGLGFGAVRTLNESGGATIPTSLALAAAVLSILSKEGLYRWTANVAVRTDSQLLLANAWHHRSDALSSIGVVCGIVGARLGFRWMDPAAAIVVCALVIKVGWDLGIQAARDLVDTAVDEPLRKQIRGIIADVAGVRSHHEPKTRRVGKDVFIDVDIEVDPDLNVVQGHDVARDVRTALLSKVKNVRDAMVHVEPLGGRDGGLFTSERRETVISKAEQLARACEGVLGIHATRIIPLAEGYLLNLDIEVSPSLTVLQAHEIAHRIKQGVRTIPDVSDAVIHVDVHGG